MYFSLDEKRFPFYVNFFPLCPFKSVHRENKFCKIHSKWFNYKNKFREILHFLTSQRKRLLHENFCI